MNKELGRKVIEAIKAHRDKFDYTRACSDPGTLRTHCTPSEILDNSCGTVGCVAGFTAALCGHKPREGVVFVAKKALDITQEESLFLFYGHKLHTLPGIPLEHAGPDEAVSRLEYLLNRESGDE